MALINHDSKLSEIILHDPSTITVLDRFGIALGVGDATIEQACSQHDIDVNFFVTILNTYINENYFPQQALEQFEVTEIVEYLSKTNSYYEHYILPNIERHFSFLIARAPSHNNNIIIMKQFFDEMKKDAEILCQDFPFVRVDFFLANNTYYFAELTFTPSAGMMPFNPDKYDLEWGQQLDISRLISQKK